MKIEVIKADIGAGYGSLWSQQECPIWQAFRRALGNPEEKIYIGMSFVTIGNKKYSLPPKARKWLSRAIKTGKVEPFSFNF